MEQQEQTTLGQRFDSFVARATDKGRELRDAGKEKYQQASEKAGEIKGTVAEKLGAARDKIGEHSAVDEEMTGIERFFTRGGRLVGKGVDAAVTGTKDFFDQRAIYGNGRETEYGRIGILPVISKKRIEACREFLKEAEEKIPDQVIGGKVNELYTAIMKDIVRSASVSPEQLKQYLTTKYAWHQEEPAEAKSIVDRMNAVDKYLLSN